MILIFVDEMGGAWLTRTNIGAGGVVGATLGAGNLASLATAPGTKPHQPAISACFKMDCIPK